MRAFLLLLLLTATAGCRSMTTTRPSAPLPRERTIGIGGSATASAGIQTGVYYEDNDVGTGYAAALGGALTTVRALRLGDFSLELDGGLGVGIETASRFGWGPGGIAAARVWWWPEGDLALGVDVATSVGLDLSGPRGPSVFYLWVQPEARLLAAWRARDGVWFTARPGLLYQSAFFGGHRLAFPAVPGLFTYVDLPLALTFELAPMRLNLEAAIATTIFPLPLPSARVGVSLAWLW